MPTVPRATRTVDVTSLPRARITTQRSAEAEGARTEIARGGAESAAALRSVPRYQGLAGVGQEAERMGAALFRDIQEKQRAKADRTALHEANNRLSDWKNKRLYDPQEGAFAQKGKNALPLPEQLRHEYDALAGEIEQGLSSDEQRVAFAQLRSNEWQALDLQVRRHVFGEMQTYEQGELTSLVDNSINAAVLSATDPLLVKREMDKAVTALKTSGPDLGMGPEAIDAKVAAVQSKVHVGVIGNLISQERTQQAQDYFEATRSQIDGNHIDTVQQALATAGVRKQAQQQTDAIVRAGGTPAEQRQKAAAIDDPKVRDDVENRLDRLHAIAERAKKDAEEDTMRDGYNIIDSQGFDVTKIPPSQWESYSGATRSAMIGYANQRAAGRPTQTDDPTYYALMQQASTDPETFLAQNLLNYRHKLDDGDWKQVVGLQGAIRNGQRDAADKVLAPFATHTQLLNDSLELYGINPNAKPGTPEANAVAQLRRMVDRRVEVLQGGGKKATNQDIQAEIDSILSASKTVKGSWWNLLPGGAPFSDQTRRLIDTTVHDIPAADRKQIEAALRQMNRPVSDAVILDLYLETQLRLGRK